MRAWPISGDDSDSLNAAFRDFAVEALQVPDTVVRETRFVDIIHVRSSPNNAIYLEALITFKEVSDRDYYFAKACNLAECRNDDGTPSAGLCLDIPLFLLPTFKILNEHGYDIRNVNSRETRRYIKFDEENLSLFLEVKLPGNHKWIKIRPDQARSFNEEKEREDYQSIKKSLLCPLRSTTGQSNANLVPLGMRAQTSGPPSASSASTSSSGSAARWVPPSRQPPTARTAGYSLRNSSEK